MISFFDLTSFIISVFILLVIPGLLLLHLLKINRTTWHLRLLLSFGVSLSFLSLVGLVLNYTVGISTLSLRLVYGSLTIAWFLFQLHRFSKQLQKIRFKTIFNYPMPALAMVFLAVCILMLALVRWSPYYNFHSADAGWHVFWSKRIINSHSLPNYDIVRPYNPPQLFVYGSHFLLASFSLLVDVPLGDIYWLPLVLFYSLILLAILEIAKVLTNSYWAGLIASIFYAVSQIPAARVFLGNLPDIIGYFLLIITLLIVIEFYTSDKLYLVFGLVAPSIVSYYQYATLSTILTLAFALVLMFLFFKEYLYDILTMIHAKIAQVGIFFILIATLTFACHTTYINVNSLRILSSTNWSAYVPTISDYPVILGHVHVTVGIAGLIVLVSVSRIRGVVIASWFLALVVGTNAPLLGVGVEPSRFLWHLIEPLSVSGGALVYLAIDKLIIHQQKSFDFWGVRLRIVYSDERSQLITKSLAIIVTIVFFISLIATPPLYPARASEPYLADDMAVSLWLASSSVETSVIAIDADIDPTATWVQAYSQKPLFLYRADYAIEVASPPYRYFYENASYLFNNPFSPDVIQIARNFNLSYVIAHGHAVEAFSLSPFFEPVYLTSSAVVFKPRIIAAYGVVTSASGYYVTMTSGRKAVVLTRINIAIQTNNIRNFTLPIYGQVAIRPLPSTAFVASVDAHNSTEFTVPNNSVIDTCPGLAKLFKLQEIGLGGLRFVNVTLGPGLHTLTITMTSDVGFAIYVEDLKVQGISIDPSLLTLVTNN